MTDKKDRYLLSRITAACQRNYEPQFFDFYDEMLQKKIVDTINNSGVPYLFWRVLRCGTKNVMYLSGISFRSRT